MNTSAKLKPKEWQAMRARQIKQIYAESDKTASSIAACLTNLTGERVSIGSVVGFYHRHGHLLEVYPLQGNEGKRFRSKEEIAEDKRLKELARSEAAKLADQKRRAANRVADAPTLDPADIPFLPAFDGPENHKLLYDLADNECRWPVSGKGAATLFCADKATHKSYCRHHFLRSRGLSLA